MENKERVLEQPQKKSHKTAKWAGAIVGTCCVLGALLALTLTGAIGGNKGMGKIGTFSVGADIELADITEFYYTHATATYPPEYQRYHFAVEQGQYLFYHVKNAFQLNDFLCIKAVMGWGKRALPGQAVGTVQPIESPGRYITNR